MGGQPLAVPGHRPGQGGQADADHQHRQRQDRRLLGGPADEIAGQADQGGAGDDGHGAEPDRQGQLAGPQPQQPGQPGEHPQRRHGGDGPGGVAVRCGGRPGHRTRSATAGTTGDLGAGPGGPGGRAGRPPAVEPDLPVRPGRQVPVVGEEQDRGRPAQRLDAGGHLAGRGLVQVDGRLVQHEQPGVSQQRPGQPEALALAGRQPPAAGPDRRVVPLGQALDEAVGGRPVGRRPRPPRRRRPGGQGRCCPRPSPAPGWGAGGPRRPGRASCRGRCRPAAGRRRARRPRPAG